ncbi:hypothetical protein GIB67_022467 [Kingdonia uniflora]|uniref:Uncharacterized protein n=1 Tax=Kingdonia uniflora TaxID=39325 RepID=A0A7J7MU91_9MAGN|nr:hypothetical protein GIB67_022467 [Kingdonia uniflora]
MVALGALAARHVRSKKLLNDGKLKVMLNSDGEIEEDPETHAERHARTLSVAQDLANKSKKKNKGRQRQRLRLKDKKMTTEEKLKKSVEEPTNKSAEKPTKKSAEKPAKKKQRNKE